ncbi:hypothetical protein ACS0TY_023165 [Phlomoides rotata]
MQELNTEIVSIRLGNIHVIPITSSELAREFLKKHDAIFASRPDMMSARLTSNGYLALVLSPLGDQWRKMRKIVVSEVLSPHMHQWLHEKRCEEADHIVQWVHNQCEKGLVNVREVAQHYCGNVIRRVMFNTRFFGPGTEDGGPGFEEREYMDGLFTILSYVYGFAIADYAPWLEVLDLDGCKKILGNAIKNVRKHQDSEITKRVEMWQEGIRETREDILDVLINLKNSENNPSLSIEEIKTLILELIVGAVDNPSNAVEWAMAEMLNQPHLLARATEELDRVVGKERLVQESDLSKLNYLKACIKESFRLHPLAPFNLPHVSTKDVVVGGYFIPKGSHVLISRPALGRNPKVWEDALEFKPERHIKNDHSDVAYADPELNMFSFSTGRRGCPGVVLGSTMTTIVLARLIQGFSWKPPPGVTNISLDESDHDGSLAKPLISQAIARLDSTLYLQLVKN